MLAVICLSIGIDQREGSQKSETSQKPGNCFGILEVKGSVNLETMNFF